MAQLKEDPKKIPNFYDLPKDLQRKYKNSIIFEKENKTTHKILKFDAQKLKQRKIDKQKTIQQKLQQFVLNATEQKRLRQVFNEISNMKQCFGREQVVSMLKKMKTDMLIAEIDLMIWQFDEDLDGKITFSEFQKMYKMCMMDKLAAEPKKLFHLTQYLMYCKNGCYEIIPENTYELQYIRANDTVKSQLAKSNNKANQQNTNQVNQLMNCTLTNLPRVKQIFQESIRTIFGDDYENQRDDGIERTITFKTYLQKKTKKAIQNRREAVEKTKAKYKTLKP